MTSSSSTACAPRSARPAQRHVRRDPRRRPGRPVHPRAAAPQPGAAARAGRRGRDRRHHPDRRPGPDHRPHRRHAGRAAAKRARLLDRPDVRRRDDRGDDHCRPGSRSAPTTSRSPAASSTWAATRWARASTRTRGSCPRSSSTPTALVMGTTAENLHDRFPHLTKERADAFAAAQPAEDRQGVRRRQDPARPGPRRRPASAEHGWGLATADEPPRPGTTVEGLAGPEDAVPPARPGHRRQRAPASTTAPPPACSPPSRRRRRARPAGRRCGWSAYAFAGVEPEVMGVGPIPSTEKALRQRRPDHRRHRAVRAQRGVRRAGAGVPRPLRHRRRRPAGQPVRRRDRGRPPAGLLRRPADDPAGPAVRRAPRGPLRPDRDVRRPRHGRHRDLGEPELRQRARGRPHA